VKYQKEANRYTNNSRTIINELAYISAERDKLRTMSSFLRDVIASNKKIDSLNVARNAFSSRSKQIFADLDIMYKTVPAFGLLEFEVHSVRYSAQNLFPYRLFLRSACLKAALILSCSSFEILYLEAICFHFDTQSTVFKMILPA